MTALFGYGFRPFFLLAGIQAIVVMAIWLAVLNGTGWSLLWASPIAWHAHEMVFGFITAAVAGFLLTAVASWTGQRGFAGLPLMVLVAIWLAGRIAMMPGSGIPQSFVAAIDLAFLPAIGIAIAPSLIRAGNVRNFPMVVFLALLFVANLDFHAPSVGIHVGLDGPALALDTVLLMIALIGGRIVPAFTGNALRSRDPGARVEPFGWVDRAAIAAVLVVLVLDQAMPGEPMAGGAALVAGMLHAWRVLRWRGWRTAGMPIAWILHVAYAWIPVGLGLKGVATLWQIPAAAGWTHALGAGAFATMIMAVMTRAALGHTGRALIVSTPVVIAYLSLTLAALTRVLAPAIAPAAPLASWTIAGMLWIVAFALYLIVYAPILARPRVDGRPG